ncbi:MAG: thioredoxin-like domain-containing protein [Vulcanimicrobiaceae bacterium]
MKYLRFGTSFCAVLAMLMPFSQTPAAQTATLAPVLHAAEGWVNEPATAAGLAGKVVVVDVFTFGCINCKNVTPNLKALYREDSNDVAIVGVHSPETPYEKDRANVVENLRTQGIVWPVAIDNGFAIWNAYGVDAWPTQLIFDRHGRLRKTVVGDSQDELVDSTIKALVAER